MPSSIGHGAARQAGAAAARHERDARRVAQPHGVDDLVGGFGEDDGARASAVGRQPIGFVGRQRARAGEQPVGRNQAAERRQQVLAVHACSLYCAPRGRARRRRYLARRAAGLTGDLEPALPG